MNDLNLKDLYYVFIVFFLIIFFLMDFRNNSYNYFFVQYFIKNSVFIIKNRNEKKNEYKEQNMYNFFIVK